MTDKERREDDALKNLIQAAYDFSDEELLADLEEVEATLSDSDFPGIEERMYRKMMAKLAEEETAEHALEKEEELSAVRSEEVHPSVEVPKHSEIITEIPPIAATVESGGKVVRFGKKKVVVVGILAAAFVGMLGVTAIGGKNYFFRDREKEIGIAFTNDNYVKECADLEGAYEEIERVLQVKALRLGYIPTNMKFSEAHVLDKKVRLIFNYNDAKVYFLQESQSNEASVGINSDKIITEEYVYNEWVKTNIYFEEEYLEDNKEGCAMFFNIGNVRYRVFGQIPKEELKKIALNLSF